MNEIQSRVFEPNEKMCCEACVFGSGHHARFCPHVIHYPGREYEFRPAYTFTFDPAGDCIYSAWIEPTRKMPNWELGENDWKADDAGDAPLVRMGEGLNKIEWPTMDVHPDMEEAA